MAADDDAAAKQRRLLINICLAILCVFSALVLLVKVGEGGNNIHDNMKQEISHLETKDHGSSRSDGGGMDPTTFWFITGLALVWAAVVLYVYCSPATRQLCITGQYTMV